MFEMRTSEPDIATNVEVVVREKGCLLERRGEDEDHCCCPVVERCEISDLENLSSFYYDLEVSLFDLHIPDSFLKTSSVEGQDVLKIK